MFDGIIEYDYNWFKQDVDFLKYKLNYQKFNPDIIIGVTRGGLIPAVYLSHALKTRLVPVTWSFRDDDRQESILLSDLDKRMTYNILVVDDICDSGKTLSTLVDDLVASSNFKVKTATLWYNFSQPFIVDFYINSINRNLDKRFIKFPWE